MSAAIAESEFYKISTALRYVAPSTVFNNPKFLTKHFAGKACYAVLTLDKESNKIEASLSWEDSGFDLTIEFSKLQGKVYKVYYTTKEHDNWLTRYDTMTDSIIEDLIESSLIKIDDALVSKKEERNGRNFKGIYFKKKKEGKETPRYIELVDIAKTRGVITHQFKSFLKRFSKRLSAAGHPKRDYL